MELKEFTKLALIDIVEAVKEANDSFGEEAFIGNKRSDSHYWITEPQLVEFDVAITTTDSDNIDGKAKLNVMGIINVGGGGTSQSINQTVSRIKYTVPLVLRVSTKSIQINK